MAEWIFLAIGTSAMFAFANIFEKIVVTKHIKDAVVFSSLWGFWFFPLFVLSTILGVSYPDTLRTLVAISFGFIVTFAGMALYHALEHEEVSRVMPLWQASSVIVILASIILVGEKLTLRESFAFILVFAGSFLLSIKKTKTFFKLTPFVSFIFLAGTVVAFSRVSLKYASQNAHPLAIITLIFAGHLIALGLLAALKGFRRRFIVHLKELNVRGLVFFIAAAFSIFIADFFFLTAINQGPTSLVIILSRMSSVFILLYATLASFWLPHLIKENTSRFVFYKKTLAIVAIVSGIAMLQ